MLLKTLKELEVLLHDPMVRCDVERLRTLLHSSFREFGRSGTEYTRNEILAHVSSDAQQPLIWSQEFALEVLSENLALLTYRSAHVSRGGELQSYTNRASLWQLTENGWKMRFHQGTPTEPFEKQST